MRHLQQSGISSWCGIMNAHPESILRPASNGVCRTAKPRGAAVLLPLYHDLEEGDIARIIGAGGDLARQRDYGTETQ